jgi:molybdopterin molybdotransferase
LHFQDKSAFCNINTPENLRRIERWSNMTHNNLTDAMGRLSGHDPDTLSVEQTRQNILQQVQAIHAEEAVAIHHALGRVLATDVISPIDVPSHANSAMDGYALQGSCLSQNAAVTLKIVGSALAGHVFHAEVRPGECIRIMTGAVLPDSCDTVVPQEITQAQSDTAVLIPAGAVKAGDNCRLRGEDLRAGSPAMTAGKILRPADLGMLASLGIATVPVKRRLRVAFFSTGDELRSIGEKLDEGCVYDSNRYTLQGMLTRLGCDTVDLGVVKDEPAALAAAFRSACEQADAIITSGGVSVGVADYLQQTLRSLGDVHFWKIAMRPGRPLAFGELSSCGNRAWLFGLPGNPVAVMVSFYMIVRDALLTMMGAQVAPLPLMRVTAQASIPKKPGRTEYQRGILSIGADGRQQVRITGAQGSGILRSMSEANCIVVLHHNQGRVDAGDPVDVLLFEGLI